jgi:methyl-accepting chemotaxis protein
MLRAVRGPASVDLRRPDFHGPCTAVEEQGAAPQEISCNVQQAAQGTRQVSTNISDVQRGAGETGSASSHVLVAAQSMSRDSNRLKLEVVKFLNSVRAA